MWRKLPSAAEQNKLNGARNVPLQTLSTGGDKVSSGGDGWCCQEDAKSRILARRYPRRGPAQAPFFKDMPSRECLSMAEEQLRTDTFSSPRKAQDARKRVMASHTERGVAVECLRDPRGCQGLSHLLIHAARHETFLHLWRRRQGARQ